MEDKNKYNEDATPEKKTEEIKDVQEEARELSDETLEDVAGGTIPIIDAF